MPFSKYFYKQFNKDIHDEVKQYEAKQEHTPIKITRCKHRKAKFIDGELRCSCGAAWSGTRLHELEKILKEKK